MLAQRIVNKPMFDEAGDMARMRAVAGGDAAALESLYRDYAEPLMSFFFRFTFDRSLSEDLLQETFLRVWRSAKSFREESKVSTFLFQIAKNLALTERSRFARRRERSGTLMEPGAGEHEEALRSEETHPEERRELRRLVRLAVSELPDGQRMCIVLAQFEGMKQADIAAILGIPVGTVKSRLHHAEAVLKEKLIRLLDLQPDGADVPEPGGTAHDE